MNTPAPDRIRAALAESAEEPEGPARNARAEGLLAEAEATGDRPLTVDALLNLIGAYNFSAESDKTFVPFSRLLRMWDEAPADFDEAATHRLHWIFKWVSSGMLDQPHIPLESIETWQAEMAHRYRLAGHSERAVRQSEFNIARHIGDRPRAARAYAAWLSADRDEMSDCHACELHEQGSWQERQGDDEKALRLWTPVLGGDHSCLHEPHAVLASSLLPLVRLGHTDRARAHHLRGYRMARSMASMRYAVAAHVEFCARTGNEPRGLEILAEQTGHWEPAGDPDTYLDWMVSTALLMRRMTELGHSGQPVPGPPEREWTAVTLLEHAADEALAVAARFDRRNGSTAVSDAARARMAGAPLVERLPLGLRPAPLGEEGARGPAAVPATAPGGNAPAPAAASSGRSDPRTLLAEARTLSERGHPAALDRWRELAAVVEREGTLLLGGERAELLDHRAMEIARTDPATGAALFTEAAALFSAAEQPGDALACRARASLATAFAGRPAEALAALEPLCAEAVSLHAEGRASTRHTTAVLLSRARIRTGLLATADDPHQAADALDRELAELLAFAGPRRVEPGVLARIAEATESRGRLAGQRGDPAAAARLLDEAARTFHAARRPWQATEAELAHARALLAAGDPAGAEAVLRATAADTGRNTDGGATGGADRRADGDTRTLSPWESARLHLVLADALGAQERPDEEAACLLEAAHWADAADEGAGLGAVARLRLGGRLLDLDRWEEAATVLEGVLPDLLAGHDEGEVVQARWWLGQALTRSGAGEQRAAAEQFLLAADTAQAWEDQHDHAMLAHLAADALKSAELPDEALQAYERAEKLWRPLGETHAVIRSLRSRAWIAMSRQDVPGAIEMMGAALNEAESGIRTASDEQERTALRMELGHGYRQTAELLLQATDGPPDEERNARHQYEINLAAYEEAVIFADHALTAFAACGGTGLAAHTGTALMAGWLEADLGRRTAAADRARSVLGACPEGAGDPDGTLAGRREEAAALLGAALREDVSPTG
ncbi:tetratricopeptide repeat protein [Streptomyces sp. N2-109]|uniref:Tetratricopeptide repeat protein n=1 Tax=Streptomyces gossypii TaxID=2883101 RepID=A0ABT2K1K0_9ACTN|nr:tetratricopeptide repeat protein [Streptomyces gossypii]MCT2593971.1 tetratricopeptide repeat protein [Streptomyces gossypii]